MKEVKRIKPSDNELSILQVLWALGPSTVREVNDRLNQQKPTGYTTTLKLMQIMYDKGLLTRTSEGTKGRSHIYSPTVKESQVSTHLLDSFIQRVFQGSTAKLVMRALGRDTTSPEEIAQIKQFLNELDKNQSS